MTTVHQRPAAPLALPPGTPADWQTALLGWKEPFMAFTKGAVDSLLEACTDVWVEGRAEPVSEHWRQRIQAANDDLAQNGMRVLGLAFRPVASLPAGNSVDSLQALESTLIFIGLVPAVEKFSIIPRYSSVFSCGFHLSIFVFEVLSKFLHYYGRFLWIDM